MILEKASTAIAANPDLSDFSAAISGQWNPAVNLVSVLDNGPYNVFAPTNEAFAKMDPAELEALKANPAELTSVLYYHMALGLLGPDDIHGKLTTQQGKQITITGKGGDLKFDDTAKVVCGGISAQNAKLYMIDTVLNPNNALAADADHHHVADHDDGDQHHGDQYVGDRYHHVCGTGHHDGRTGHHDGRTGHHELRPRLTAVPNTDSPPRKPEGANLFGRAVKGR